MTQHSIIINLRVRGRGCGRQAGVSKSFTLAKRCCCLSISRYTRHMYLYLYVADVSVSVCKFLRLSVCLTVCVQALRYGYGRLGAPIMERSTTDWFWFWGLLLGTGKRIDFWRRTHRCLSSVSNLSAQCVRVCVSVRCSYGSLVSVAYSGHAAVRIALICSNYLKYLAYAHTHTHIMPVFVCVQMVFFQRPRSALL